MSVRDSRGEQMDLQHLSLAEVLDFRPDQGSFAKDSLRGVSMN
jgi:hypothetical protein